MRAVDAADISGELGPTEAHTPGDARRTSITNVKLGTSRTTTEPVPV